MLPCLCNWQCDLAIQYVERTSPLRRPSGAGAAPHSGAPLSSQAAATGDCPAAKPAAQAKQQQGAPVQQRQLTQLYLDVGQRHFHSYRCPACGMLYTRGTESGELGQQHV